MLDRFDGFVWQRAPRRRPAGDRRAARPGGDTPGAELAGRHPDWLSQASFEVRALSSGFVIGAGTPQAIQGLDGVAASADGTLQRRREPLGRGDEYSVISYVPQPDRRELRARPGELSGASASSARPCSALPVGSPRTSSASPPRARAMPLWGERPTELAASCSPRPTGRPTGSPASWSPARDTPYDAVRAIERHLRSSYDYTPDVPEHAYPLPSFLFEDRAGYCQQFAGSMALMLRMVGIPSRVVSGFAPGQPRQRAGRLRGPRHRRPLLGRGLLPRHRLGHLRPDPGGGAGGLAVARAASSRRSSAAAGRRRPRPTARRRALERGVEGERPAARSAAASAAALGGARARARRGWRRSPRRSPRSPAGAGAGRSARGGRSSSSPSCARRSRGLGWRLPGRDAPCSRSSGASQAPAGRGVARYAAALRAHRYAPAAGPPPGPRERRALRRALARTGPAAAAARPARDSARRPGGRVSAEAFDAASRSRPGLWRWTRRTPSGARAPPREPGGLGAARSARCSVTRRRRGGLHRRARAADAAGFWAWADGPVGGRERVLGADHDRLSSPQPRRSWSLATGRRPRGPATGFPPGSSRSRCAAPARSPSGSRSSGRSCPATASSARPAAGCGSAPSPGSAISAPG